MIVITNELRQQIKDAIKAQKWDRSSYEYALHSMLPYRYFDSNVYKKAELIDLFYATIETKFHLIRNYTTFKHIVI